MLVTAAVRAIDRHGPTAGLADFARAAGVSKPVLYRYFADKADLHAAVGDWGAGLVLERLAPALAADGGSAAREPTAAAGEAGLRPSEPLGLRERVEVGMDAYLGALAEHPNVFLLLTSPGATGRSDPLARGKAAIAEAIARLMGDLMRGAGVDSGGAVPWAHAVVGMGLSVGEWWLRDRTMSRQAVAAYLSGFLWHALAGLAEEHGLSADEVGRLHARPAERSRLDEPRRRARPERRRRGTTRAVGKEA